MAKLSAPPPSNKRFDEDAPTQVDELAPAIPRASVVPGANVPCGSCYYCLNRMPG